MRLLVLLPCMWTEMLQWYRLSSGLGYWDGAAVADGDSRILMGWPGETKLLNVG